ncbi:MAG TPA: DUF5916 domain-containing protein [Gemmatimonadaceae bacterium]|nr:DUF5916 domain-containing protein [Gemmatimonadaceae bacterium]
MQRPRIRASLLVVAFVWLALPALASAQTSRPVLIAGRAGSGLRIDGRLDESVWSTADSIPNLTTTEPVEGGQPVGRTVVRVLANVGTIIIGVRADDPEPQRITSFARDRDASLQNEDHIRFVLDTYRDGRSGYVFAVNANGARYDALVANQGEGENSDWDGVWEAATQRTSTGWSAEIRIPVKSLLFAQGLTSWGFNIERRVQRLQETARWASPVRNYRVTHVSRGGLLDSLPAFTLGLGLAVRPSLTAGLNRPRVDASTQSEADLSGDVTQRVGANTLASLTLNTDFAETEVDTRRTNLTRFPLFFPEKRTFFVEGADIFDFGLGLGGSTGRGSDVLPFFSRRIGLLAGNEVPLAVGGKVNGRLGRSNFGALVVRTSELDTLPTDNTLGVARLRQNVLGESSVGAIATFGDPLGRSDSWLIGSDAIYQTSRFRGDKNFLVGVWGVTMDRDGLTGRKSAYGLKIDYPNDLWDIAGTYKVLGDGFDPSLGFVPRRGVQIATLNVNFAPRPKRPVLGLDVRRMLHELENTLVSDLDGHWESYRVFMAPINWTFESGDRFEFNVVPVGERLVQPFEIADSVLIRPGSYHWNRYRLEGAFAAKRIVSGQLTWWFGDFYSGSLDELSLTSSFKPSPLFIVEVNGTRNVGRLREGRFTQDVIGTRVRVNLSSDLQISSYVQYDNQSEDFGTNSRVRWAFSPLGDLFVVYNHNMSTLDPTGNRRWQFDSNQLLVKVQYVFRY